jgi:hypothetical protein
VGLAPGGCRLAGANLLSNGPSNLQAGSDGKTALQSGKQGGQGGSRLPGIAARLLDLWQRTPAPVQLAFALLGAVSTLLGIPGLAEGVSDWWCVLSFVGSSVGQYAIPITGATMLAAILVLQVADRRTRRRPSSVVDDIKHREGCPRNPGRQETWKDVREDTGIEYTVGKCNDCGRTAYRHGDVPVRPPAPSRESEPQPDPRIALASEAENRAAELRALCARWEGRISFGQLRPPGDTEDRAAVAQADALAEYERVHSVETYRVFDQLAAAGVIRDPARRRVLIESPRFLGDLREAADVMQAAARALRRRAQGTAEPVSADRMQLLRQAYRTGSLLLQGLPWAEGAPTSAEEAAEAQRRAWKRAVDWGIETWEMLRDHFGGHAERAFFGDPDWGDYALGRVGFQMLASKRRSEGVLVYSWMDEKLKVLADIIERYDRP